MTRGQAVYFLVLFSTAHVSCARADVSRTGEFDRALAEFDDGQRLRTEQPDKARPLFRSAAERLESLAATIDNGFLEYNLGNCHLQAGDVGRAVLHYLRAERLIPRNPWLADNLTVARSRCLLTIPSTRTSAVLRGVFFWHFQTSLPGRAKTAAIAYALFWTLLAVWFWFHRRGVLIAALLSAIVAAGSGGSYAAQRWLDRNAPQAVVVANDVTVYKGPATTYQRQFEQPLQPGLEVSVHQRRSGWSQIELPDGNRGWVESNAIEVVPVLRSESNTAFLQMQ